jgi:hypothetical protein
MAGVENLTDTHSEIVERHRKSVIGLVSNGVEDDYVECKREWTLRREDRKAQLGFIKLAQSMANAPRSKESFLVIGADNKTKTFHDVTNCEEFDAAKVSDLLKQFLDPTPSVQVYNNFKTDDGKSFVLIVFPPNQMRPILINKDSEFSGERIRKGDIWIKDGTGMNLATRRQIDRMYEERLEQDAENRARQRFAHLRDELELRVRSTTPSTLPNRSLLLTSRAELSGYIAEALSDSKILRLNMLVEVLRDILVVDWATRHRQVAGEITNTVEDFEAYLINEIEPALIALTEIALITIKNRLDRRSIDLVAKVFEEHFNLVSKLSDEGLNTQMSAINRKAWHTLMQVYFSARCISIYALSRQRKEYLRPIQDIVVHTYVPGGNYGRHLRPLQLFPFHFGNLIEELPELNNGLIQCTWELGVRGHFGAYFLGYEGFLEPGILHEAILELNSFLGLGMDRIGLPGESLTVDSDLNWIYFTEFYVHKSRQVGFQLLNLWNIFSHQVGDLENILMGVKGDSRQLEWSKPQSRELVFGKFLDSILESIHGRSQFGWSFERWDGDLQILSDLVEKYRTHPKVLLQKKMTQS